MSLLEVRGLCKSFGPLEVLRDVNLTVEEGERIAIIGGSGCGKSVLLRSLELLETPDAGRILIDGEEITARGADINRIRRKMGMVYQKFYLFSHMDVMDNLCLAPTRLLGMAREEAEARATEWLEKVGLTSRAHAMPSVLSGGQQQRIAICRSLMMEPKLLLFDEPTSALDPTMVGEVLAMIRMLSRQDMTMLIVTHEMNFARELANRVLFLAEGGIYEEGTPEEIFDHPRRERTLAFIRKLKYFTYAIHDRGFDLMEMQGGIHLFAEKYGMGPRLAYRLQLCCEELAYEFLGQVRGPADITLDVSYAADEEGAGTVTLRVVSAGEPFNPLEEAERDGGVHLGVTMLKKCASRLEYRFEGAKNILEAVL